ncbi:MAG: decaprenyl-phosphate phosphoribosyltransferase [Ardenticatenia bacterium]|nr:MAG: decaprenyl-phosphate phosphoribosyltransferase [Ardenticatenia bacterium]
MPSFQPHESDTSPYSQMMALLETMRPKQWTKNLVIFAGLVFSDDRLLLSPPAVLTSVAAFGLFCLLSSAVYILNDLADIEKDRQHPVKRHRPLPSGRLKRSVAIISVVLLFGTLIPCAFWLQKWFGVAALAYVLNNLAYTFILKNIVLLDVFSIAAGFVLRAMAGAFVIEAPISPWLYVVTILLALFLAISKRRHELILLQQNRGSHRRVLEEYTEELLDEMLSVVTASTVIAYSLYTFTAQNLPDNHAMMLTIPFALYGLFRYLYLIHRKNLGGAPEEALLQDKPLMVTILLWGVLVISILYIFPR